MYGGGRKKALQKKIILQFHFYVIVICFFLLSLPLFIICPLWGRWREKNYLSQEGSCISLPLVALRWLLVTKVIIIAHYVHDHTPKMEKWQCHSFIIHHPFISLRLFFLLILVANYSDLCEISDSSMLKKVGGGGGKAGKRDVRIQ